MNKKLFCTAILVFTFMSARGFSCWAGSADDANTRVAIINFLLLHHTTVAEGSRFVIDPIANATTPEYIFFDEPGWVDEQFDEPGHYTSVTPHLSGETPVNRVVYTLAGADAEEFIINRKTGVVRLDYKDFEHPTDANGDNIYEVTIIARDEAGNSASMSWSVTVTDEDEGGARSHHFISMNGASLVRVKAGQPFVDPGVTLFPVDGGNTVELSTVIYSDYNLDPPLAGIDTNNPQDRVFHIIYQAEDSANEEKSAPQRTRTVIVEDADPFASLGESVTVTVTAADSSSKVFSSLEEDYIQKALYFARDHNGGTLFLSPGTHFFKRQLVIYSKTTLRGSLGNNNERLSILKLMDFAIRKAWKNSSVSWGNTCSLLVNSGAPSYNTQFESDMTERESKTHDIQIRDLVLDGNRERQRSWKSAGSNNSIGIKFYDTTGMTIDNILLTSTLSDGIATEGGADLSITQSTFRYMGHSAVYLVNTDTILADHLTIDLLSNSGIRLMGGRNITITNNHIFGTTPGGNYAIQLSHNYSGGVGDEMENIRIENNIIRHVAYAGIGLYVSRPSDVMRDVAIRNNIIYQCGTVTSNMPHFVANEPASRIHEGGGIVIQHVKDITIDHNTIFNNHGSGIRLDMRFYIPDLVEEDWNNLDELDRMAKQASITNNLLIGNKSSSYEEYNDVDAYGLMKRVALHCGVDNQQECQGTIVTTANNIIAGNDSGRASANIVLDDSDNRAFPGFVDAPVFAEEIREIFYALDTEVNYDFLLSKNVDLPVGASEEMIQRSIDLYEKYRTFFEKDI